MGIYSRLSAVRYASRWALSRNSDFHNYTGHGGGGDCTNFVSQCLLAGGWQMIWGTKRADGAWWCNGQNNSNSWSSARWFYDFLDSSPRVYTCEEDDLDLGDIVMMQNPGTPHPDHAMIVTHITWLSTPNGQERQVSVSYHSTDTLHNPLSEIKSRYSKSTKYFYLKVANTFADADNEPEFFDNFDGSSR
ncbi:MAG TPA: amidase domain-containing protein [Pirellulales bacterium]|jgi:hypothetical protein|nr:amidase domain-containing protein [Pirellulales bacterium]